MRSDHPPYFDERQMSGAVDFDASLEAFLAGGDREALLRAAAIVSSTRAANHLEPD